MACASSTAAMVTAPAASSAPRVKDEKDDAPAERAGASLLTALPRFPIASSEPNFATWTRDPRRGGRARTEVAPATDCR